MEEAGGGFRVSRSRLRAFQDGDDDDEDWGEETTKEAQRRRMEEISDHAKNLTLSEDLEKPLEERVNLFYNFVKVSLLLVDLFFLILYCIAFGQF